jgi:hypothetical protein
MTADDFITAKLREGKRGFRPVVLKRGGQPIRKLGYGSSHGPWRPAPPEDQPASTPPVLGHVPGGSRAARRQAQRGESVSLAEARMPIAQRAHATLKAAGWRDPGRLFTHQEHPRHYIKVDYDGRWSHRVRGKRGSGPPREVASGHPLQLRKHLDWRPSESMDEGGRPSVQTIQRRFARLRQRAHDWEGAAIGSTRSGRPVYDRAHSTATMATRAPWTHATRGPAASTRPWRTWRRAAP